MVASYIQRQNDLRLHGGWDNSKKAMEIVGKIKIWNLGLGLGPKLRIFYCHRFGQPMVHLVLDWNFMYGLRQKP